jgi:hypothetical protein
MQDLSTVPVFWKITLKIEAMKKKTDRSNILCFAASLAFTIVLLSACDPIEPPYDAGIPAMAAGSYDVTEIIEGQELEYELGVHWHKNPDKHYYKFCNFSNKRIEVVFILNDDMTIRIPPQVMEHEFERFEIFAGSGELGENGFDLIYWAKDNSENITREITGRLR